MVRKLQIKVINKYFANIVKKLTQDTETSFESQESYTMRKVKFGNGNFSFEAFFEDTAANAIKSLPTARQVF